MPAVGVGAIAASRWVWAADNGGVDAGQTGVLIVDDDLQPQGFTQAAREWLTLLSARERELVALVLEGLSTRELAERMLISRYTVEDHRKSVFDKLAVRSRREVVLGIFGQAA